MKRKKKKQQSTKQSSSSDQTKLPFIEHLLELRRRFFYVALSVAIWSAVAYSVEHQLIEALLKPSHGQNFIYTSPIGGINFLFGVCLHIAVILSIPVIVYQFLRYIEPLMEAGSARFIRYGSAVSGILAGAGMLFGYFIGLPAALNFLLHQFVTAQIHPLITIEAYLSFVTMYMIGAALMFQVPLIVLFINRIKPLTPQKLFRYERWVILFAVVLALIMNPTPNLYDQIFVAGPIILSYQLSIGIIWWQHRRRSKRSTKTDVLLAEDAKIQAERLQRVRDLRTTWQAADSIADRPVASVIPPRIINLATNAATTTNSRTPAAQNAVEAIKVIGYTNRSLSRTQRTVTRRAQPYINDFIRRPNISG